MSHYGERSKDDLYETVIGWIDDNYNNKSLDELIKDLLDIVRDAVAHILYVNENEIRRRSS